MKRKHHWGTPMGPMTVDTFPKSSRLGRRGALAVPFGVWYEVVLAQLSEKALRVKPGVKPQEIGGTPVIIQTIGRFFGMAFGIESHGKMGISQFFFEPPKKGGIPHDYSRFLGGNCYHQPVISWFYLELKLSLSILFWVPSGANARTRGFVGAFLPHR